MRHTLESLVQSQRREIDETIAEAVRIAQEKEPAEIARGIRLTNDPMWRLLSPPEVYGDGVSLHEDDEVIDLWIGGSLVRHVLRRGHTTYLTARRQEKAHLPVRRILSRQGWSEEAIDAAIFELFNCTYGGVVVTRLYTGGTARALMGVRSDKVGGTFGGCASFPGGYMNESRTLGAGVTDELLDETGCVKARLLPGFTFKSLNDGINTTFASVAETEAEQVKECSYEWRDKRVTWLVEETVRGALAARSYGELVKAFRANGIKVPDDLSVADDVIDVALDIMNIHKPRR